MDEIDVVFMRNDGLLLVGSKEKFDNDRCQQKRAPIDRKSLPYSVTELPLAQYKHSLNQAT